MPQKTHTFGGRKYKLLWRAIEGLCDFDDGEITIDYRLRGRKLLETLIHEAQHASFPQMTEEEVATSARDIARLVWAHRKMWLAEADKPEQST